MLKKLYHKVLAVYLRDDEGLTAVEYAVLGGAIAGILAIGGGVYAGALIDKLDALLVTPTP